MGMRCDVPLLFLAQTLFTEQHHWHNHKGPLGFCWEGQYHSACMDEEFTDNESQGVVNVDRIIERFLNYIISRIPTQNHSHFLVMMGDDYTHSQPDHFMLNNEKLINYLNQRVMHLKSFD
uniref:Uncharacterized protein n=1 Tax=Acrobeloides nanus TaxID=290746 RepID=A0A914DQ38_9BILA